MTRRLRALDGANVLVTGGGSGIGRALGIAMASHGAHVVLGDIEADAARSAAEHSTAGRLDVSSIYLDVTDREAFARVVDQIVQTRGTIDFLVTSAGVSMGGPTHELTGEHWDHVRSVNLDGVVNGMLATYPHMVEAGRGHIVNIASGAGLVAPPFVTAYATTKHAVVGLSLGLRPEAALHGVRVSVVCPGAVETPILDSLPPASLPETATSPVTARAYLSALRQTPVDAVDFARMALRKIVKNDPVIIVPAPARALWLVYRLSPKLTLRVNGLLAKKVQRDLIDGRS